MKSDAYYLTAAIQKLKPTSEFVFYNDDYSTIEWHKLEGKAPTNQEIQIAINEIKAIELTDAENKAMAKTELLNRLGITEDEAKLLLA